MTKTKAEGATGPAPIAPSVDPIPACLPCPGVLFSVYSPQDTVNAECSLSIRALPSLEQTIP
jgi:hypothetical protein